MYSTILSSVNSSLSTIFSSGNLASFISDTKNNWQWLLAAAGFGLVIAFVVMFLLRCLAGCIVWISLFGFMFFLIGLGLIFLYNANALGSLTSAATFLGVPTIDTGYNAPIGWTLIGVGAAFFIVILCCCSRIRLAVAICKSAGAFVSSVCLIIFVPIFQAIFAVGLWAGCLVTMVYLVSAASFTATSSSYISYVASYSDPSLIRFYCFIFGTLWLNAFIGAMGIFVIASACCMWYYSHAPGAELSLPIWRSYKMVFRYHWGSLAFGSLLLAIVQFLQLMVELFKRQAQGQGQSKCVEYLIKCIECMLACV
jgi:hypothetical protein